MSGIWKKHGKVICVVFYIIALVFQLMVTTLIWKETNLFAVMLIIQVVITTIAVWAAYKIANRMLLK
ncbi:hypothetical protein P5663_00875 [Priestia flexa]|uniref:hypothetical protein n=1 Tax=Priestia flexa TaxID=86664 RepID=UPI001EF3FB78|nr:hypothetical protein [Priestia flexa]MCG7314205.1 hypothetical protein [Priestia flexa]WEZ08540.1 hypothetical protein P5663_00875 [Priestia flexa]